ncbi:MAG: DUF2274 domain-containing protein [Azospirillum sp.]|nr:DUF2274 domain-containing protein [Azospirillum sp.]
MPSLKLGAIPDDKPVRMTITLSAGLARDLDACAKAWGRETGRSLPARALVPHILENFIGSDRGFAQARKTLDTDRAPYKKPAATAV